jgi:signal transduction histidine kinase
MLMTEFLADLTRATYLVIAAVTLFDYVRQRDRARLDIAAMFAALAVTVLLQFYENLAGDLTPALRWVSGISLMAQPHLLLRLVAHFRAVPRRVQAVSTVAVLTSVALLAMPVIVPGFELPVIANLFMVAYIVWAEGYAALAFVHGSFTTAGVTRWRHTLAALGSLLVALVFVMAGVNQVAPAVAAALAPVTQTMGLASGLAFFLSFASPRYVRQVWQYAELYRFLKVSAGRPVRQRAEHVLPLLCSTAQRALGGLASVAALAQGEQDRLVVESSTWLPLEGEAITLTPGPLYTAWHERRPVVANQRDEMSPAGQKLVNAVDGHALCAVPIATAERAWGLLIVLLQRRPLFPDDDLDLLRLFAEQAGLTLDKKALLNQQDALIEHLRERTAQLEAANRELEAFSYSVSHDLRAPLRHIEGFTDLLLRTDPPEPQRRQHLQRISDAAVRMGRLIDSLLTFSRMGRAELRNVPVQLGRLLADAQYELSAETQGREIEWAIEPLPEVVGDPDLLRQVFVNLLSNAIKYSRGRHPARIEVGVERATPTEVVVFVRDNGVGFDMQYSDKLFGVFQRLHHTHEFEGVGIGLANVRRIINRHAGRTWAQGRVGEGATFYFALPAPARPALAASPLPAVPAEYESVATGEVATRD